MYRTIVTGADGSGSALAAIRSAVELAVSSGGELHIVSVSDDGELASNRWIDAESDAEEALDFAVRIADAAGARVLTHQQVGDPVAAMIRVADEVHADLIVVGHRAQRGGRFLADSISGRLTMHAHCSVLTVRSTLSL